MEPLGKAHINLSRRLLAERGKEYTPDEVLELAENALNHIREKMEAQDVVCPEDNGELVKLIGFFIIFFGIKPPGVQEL